jgi:serine/threonine protein kinase
VSEFCAGADLEANAGHLNHDPLQVLHLCAQICEGVAAAHQRGIVHRDLKPSNILLRQSEGPPVVADFGICYVEDGQRHTLTEEAVGPRLFMAPELEDGRAEEITPVADVYSLGKLLYWLIGGGQVFNREQHRDQRWNLTFICQDPSLEHVNRLLDQMIVYEPGQRLQFASQVARRARDVARLLRGGYRAVSPNIPQLCTYCGEGNYHLVARGNDTSIYNFGLNRVGQANWRVLACNQCGHVQFFRVDYAQRKEWWGEKP